MTTTLTAAESRDGVGGVIVTEETGRTLLVRLHRPDRLNSIDRPVTGALAAAVTRLEGSDHLRVGIITGEGRAFTAGADHTEVAAGEIDRLSTTEGGFAGFVRRRRTKPWFAAVNGLCFGKGLGMLLTGEPVPAEELESWGPVRKGAPAEREGGRAFLEHRPPRWSAQ